MRPASYYEREVIRMANPSLEWRPTPEEVSQVVAEMRPIIRQFVQRAKADLGVWALAKAALDDAAPTTVA